MLVSRNYQLLLVAAFALLLKAYDPVLSPVIGALDPWGWVVQTRQYLAAGQLDLFFAKTGYPPTFLYMIAGVASLGIDAYDVIRYLPIISSLSVIPIYLLINEIFESRGVAATTALLTVTARWHFMRTSIGIPEGLSHILLAFALYYMLRSLKTERWANRACAIVFMAATILCYHFTIAILTVFLILLLIFVRFSTRKKDLEVLASIVIPAGLFSGIVWYFWVVGSFKIGRAHV
jgi:asparagine N-glycosylation enzyme membrane subunit Stt3